MTHNLSFQATTSPIHTTINELKQSDKQQTPITNPQTGIRTRNSGHGPLN